MPALCDTAERLHLGPLHAAEAVGIWAAAGHAHDARLVQGSQVTSLVHAGYHTSSLHVGATKQSLTWLEAHDMQAAHVEPADRLAPLTDMPCGIFHLLEDLGASAIHSTKLQLTITSKARAAARA